VQRFGTKTTEPESCIPVGLREHVDESTVGERRECAGQVWRAAIEAYGLGAESEDRTSPYRRPSLSLTAAALDRGVRSPRPFKRACGIVALR